MTDLTPEVMHALGRLMSDTPDDGPELTEEQLIEVLRVLRRRPIIEGRAAALLHDGHGWTWPQIAEAIGVAHFTTVQKWARPYRRPATSGDAQQQPPADDGHPDEKPTSG